MAYNTDPNKTIAIVGAGITGLTVARELFRCGFKNIDIYEASGRIGGRLWSIPADGQHTTFEMGAMRMPFFPSPGSGNSLLDYYCSLYSLRTQHFPNPGSPHANTGIYVNEGYRPIPDMTLQPRMDIWEKERQKPPHEALQRVYDKWSHFAELVQSNTKHAYSQGGHIWQSLWRAIVKRYWDLSFVDIVFTPAYETYNPNVPRDFGGLGMTREESEIFYVIGAGDGGWGAFFHISALYPIRTLLFGSGTNHQLIQGRFHPENGTFRGGPHQGEKIFDSNGLELDSPNWLGVQSMAEGMLYHPLEGKFGELSLYDAIKENRWNINLYCKTPVQLLTKTASGIDLGCALRKKHYHAVVLTCPTWALQLNVDLQKFTPEMIPLYVRGSIAQSHWISSCKVFYPLKERYWEKSNIPQLIMTDSFIQGVYGYALETESIQDEPGVLLVSYTWEDDASKLLAFSDDEDLAKRCLQELDNICLRAENIATKISPFVDRSKPVVVHWSKQPTYAGCAKLYRSRTWMANLALSTYNQDYSHQSALYFAGDAYSVTSGWVEAALRTAIDTTIHVAKNLGAKFHPSFSHFDNAFKIDSSWTPEEYVGNISDVLSIPPGKYLCREGERSEDMFVLLSGTVSIIQQGEKIAQIDEEYVFLGYLSFFTEGIRTSSMYTETECRVIRITTERLEEFLKLSPNLAIKLMKEVGDLAVKSITETIELRRKSKTLND
ncbi:MULTISPECIES: FAD-dependent oxidoreductase [unclassified Microcoleus]|uniref:FAD-dependent oxidoreductase n=1 Tax=unclassified Microcoleus TaxID=2642155 RepID=UPI002FD3F627